MTNVRKAGLDFDFHCFQDHVGPFQGLQVCGAAFVTDEDVVIFDGNGSALSTFDLAGDLFDIQVCIFGKGVLLVDVESRLQKLWNYAGEEPDLEFDVAHSFPILSFKLLFENLEEVGHDR